MQATPPRARQTKKLLIATLCFLAVLPLAAFQFGDNNGLNNMPFAQVQRLVSDLPKAQKMANDGNLELLAGQPTPGNSITFRGELTDANCFLATHTHAYDHAFCAKFCTAAGSPLLFVSDQGGLVYVVLTARNGVQLPEKALNLIGVPGIVVKGRTLESNGVRTLAVESVQP
ncbi:MAG TPA: hypothetical protein VGP66_06255 [Candidatus Acidoferrum sp.]|jgi:hypothetical protein|nr:hypothetical protein [Candidatus Acidoferrum sp.]